MKYQMGKLVTFMMIAVLTACGGDSGFTTEAITATGSADSDVASVTLLASSPQLSSGDASGITITAIIKDTNNNLLANKTVIFSADSGSVTVTQGTTDDGGIATATLTSGGDETNRTITLAVVSGPVTSNLSINVSGTAITISGQSTLVSGATTPLIITLKDSFGVGLAGKNITVTSASANTLSATTLMTDSSGQATITITGDVTGTDTVTATALGATGTFSLSVSGEDFKITTPNNDGPNNTGFEVNINANQPITVTWLTNNTPQSGQMINFSATRGTLSAASMTTNGSGQASVTISSSNAGPSLVTATAVNGGPSASRVLEFLATTASTIDVQSSISTVAPNGDQATITVTVRDPSGNLVKNKQINFSLSDITGGNLSSSTDTTDSNGQASTVYSSAQTTSAKDGVTVTAVVADTTTVNSSVSFTVGNRASFITLGTGNTVEEPNFVQYNLPYAVYVADAAGGAVANVDVSLSIIPQSYKKGVRVWSNGTVWAAVDSGAGLCANEDVNLNSQLDAGEDFNSNTFLDPGNVVTVSQATVTTGADGFAFFNVSYTQDVANWVEVTLEARAIVGGTESIDLATFFPPATADDVNEETKAPPGLVSPFGVATTCANPN